MQSAKAAATSISKVSYPYRLVDLRCGRVHGVLGVRELRVGGFGPVSGCRVELIPAIPRLCRRRSLLSVALPLGWLPAELLKGAKDEAALWQQELDYTRRAAVSKAQQLLGQEEGAVPAIRRELPPLDAQFAGRLLEAPLEALEAPAQPGEALLPSFARDQYERDCAALEKQELPYWM